MIDEDQVQKSLDWLVHNAEPAAKARATRTYLEEYRKSIKADLMAHFNLSAIQAEDILEIRLRQLARLEGIRIGEELAKLREEAAGLSHLLSSEEALRACVASEIRADARKYGDDRRSLIVASE